MLARLIMHLTFARLIMHLTVQGLKHTSWHQLAYKCMRGNRIGWHICLSHPAWVGSVGLPYQPLMLCWACSWQVGARTRYMRDVVMSSLKFEMANDTPRSIMPIEYNSEWGQVSLAWAGGDV